jgi:hypothetical protein
MSNVYTLEPPTQGKARSASRRRPRARSSLTRSFRQVVLVTTLGDIEIELWPKEAPKARPAAPALRS